jgi:hypothetical protein
MRSGREIWINIKTTKITVDGHVFTVKTDAIKQYGMPRVIDHIRQHFRNEMMNNPTIGETMES